MRILCLFVVLGLGLSACQVSRELAKRSDGRQIYQMIDGSPVFSGHHTGFALYDPLQDGFLCQYNAEKYFTPASNTKILTLLTSLHVIGDSVETLRYVIRNDSLIFHGMADPAFLYSAVPSSEMPIRILQEHEGAVIYRAGEPVSVFGRGWAWDDFGFAYQVERSVFPVYGNRVTVETTGDGELAVWPKYFSDYFQDDPYQQSRLTRDVFTNTFTSNIEKFREGDSVAIPFTLSDYEITRILGDTLGRHVGLTYDQGGGENALIVFGASRDTLLKRMMQESDNFIAEQLLMQCAYKMRGTFEADSAISVAKRMIFGGVPDELRWYDGSGLSRYNLFTPRSIVWVLGQLRDMTTMEYLMEIFPAGGKSGTIEEWYGAEQPYVFAKTGTLRNQHCLSGFIRTESGRWLIFSFMHNHFTRRSSDVKREMERVLLEVRRRY